MRGALWGIKLFMYAYVVTESLKADVAVLFSLACKHVGGH